MKVVIVAGGKKPSLRLLQREIENCDLIICADSGANCFFKYGLTPDFILGDLDSIKEEALNFFKKTKCKIEDFKKEKNFTDTEAALNKALEMGANDIVFLGCTGSRVDHFMGNLGLLSRCMVLNIKASIKDDNNIVYITDKSIELKDRPGVEFSLQAYCNEVLNLSIKGAKYPLENYKLLLGDPRTISNVFLKDSVEITFDNGVILIIKAVD